ncbi:hypothetical protein [Streptomyces sp. NBC_01262]|uniref:hypothetical protein n=1 Tax=Streptomyces sp. NBC_01262 TaxID=2903803 RepID=UPI002E3437A8|nr:hypothetical protein [Streptomyces sp. NBC_01262]
MAYLAAAALIIVAAGQEQELVLFYAASVFVGFLMGLLAMTRFAHTQHKPALASVNALAATAVAFTLVPGSLSGNPPSAAGCPG